MTIGLTSVTSPPIQINAISICPIYTHSLPHINLAPARFPNTGSSLDDFKTRCSLRKSLYIYYLTIQTIHLSCHIDNKCILAKIANTVKIHACALIYSQFLIIGSHHGRCNSNGPYNNVYLLLFSNSLKTLVCVSKYVRSKQSSRNFHP